MKIYRLWAKTLDVVLARWVTAWLNALPRQDPGQVASLLNRSRMVLGVPKGIYWASSQ